MWGNGHGADDVESLLMSEVVGCEHFNAERSTTRLGFEAEVVVDSDAWTSWSSSNYSRLL